MIPQYFLDEMVLCSPTFLNKGHLTIKRNLLSEQWKVNQSYNLFLF